MWASGSDLPATYSPNVMVRITPSDTAVGTAGTSGAFSLVIDTTVAVMGDFNGDGTSDVLWQNQSTGSVVVWLVNKQGGILSSPTLAAVDPTVWKLAGIGDFNGDGTSDVLWQNLSTGSVVAWLIKNGAITGMPTLSSADPTWKLAGVGDFNGDKTSDILWYNQSTGLVGAWIIKNATFNRWAGLGTADPKTWRVAGVGDFNGDKTSDVLWQNQATGLVGAWIIKNATFNRWAGFGTIDPAAWKIIGVGDVNGDRSSDVLLQNTSTSLVGAWVMQNAAPGYRWVSMIPADVSVWKAAGIGDFNADGTSDVLWQNTATGQVGAWLVKKSAYSSWMSFPTLDPTLWHVGGTAYVQKAAHLLAASVVAAPAANVASLQQSDLQAIVSEAIARWAGAGLDAATLDRLSHVQFVITDLFGADLGEAVPAANRVYIDINAAGNGWFVDPTPAKDEEFAATGTSRQLRAVDPRAVDRIDLLTVVEHELGHIAGFDDLDALADNLMSSVLGAGVRRDL